MFKRFLSSTPAPVQEKPPIQIARFEKLTQEIKNQKAQAELKKIRQFIKDRKLEEKVAEHALASHPITHDQVKKIIVQFVDHMAKHGSTAEKAIFEPMSQFPEDEQVRQEIDRCLKLRPMVFWSASDDYVLRDGRRGRGGFEEIGTDEEKSPLVLKRFISYKEMKISELLSVIGSTHFIKRQGLDIEPQPSGHFAAVVGSRFERHYVMAFQDLVINKKQNTKENGYGKDADPTNPKTIYLRMWAKSVYDMDYFPSFDEISDSKDVDKDVNYPRIQYKYESESEITYFNVPAYIQRVKLSLVPYFLYANQTASDANKLGYIRVPGIGLGAWNVNHSHFLANLLVQACREIIDEYPLPFISDIEFAHFGIYKHESLPADKVYKDIKVHYTRNDFSAPPQTKGTMLFSGFAWDGNAMEANELLDGHDESVDAKAGKSSLILLTQTPECNPEQINSSKVKFYGKKHLDLVKEDKLVDDKKSIDEKLIIKDVPRSPKSGTVRTLFQPPSSPSTIEMKEPIALSIAESGELVIEFKTKAERDRALQEIGQSEIDLIYRKGDQFKMNPAGKTPAVYKGDDLKLFFPAYRTQEEKTLAVDLVSKEVRNKVIGLLGLPLDPKFDGRKVIGGQTKATYGDGIVEAFDGVDTVTGKNQDSRLYLPGLKDKLEIAPNGEILKQRKQSLQMIS